MAKMTDERLDREFLGRQVRKVWVTWAYAQPVRKPHWLTPWEDLSENDREVDRRIGEHIADIAIATQKTRIDAQRTELKGLNDLLDITSELREAGEKKMDAQAAEIQQQAERIKMLQDNNDRWPNPRTFHYCREGKIESWSTFLCSVCNGEGDNKDFDPVKRIRELEAVVEKWLEYQTRSKLWEDELEMSGLRDADTSIMVAVTNTFREAISLVQAVAEKKGI